MRKLVLRFSMIFCMVGMFLGPFESVEAKKIPNFWIRNLEGDRFDTRRHKGPYVISFFFVNCVPCIKEIPELHAMLSEEFPDAKVLFINPVEEDTRKDIKEFAKKLKIPQENFYRDSFGSVSKKFFKGKFAFPTIIGVSKRKLIFRHSGIDDKIKDDIREKLSAEG